MSCIPRQALCALVLGLSIFTCPEPATAFRDFLYFHQDLADIPVSATANYAFGESLAAGDFNGDGYFDLATGVPGADVGGIQGAGVVFVLYGSAAGPNTTQLQEWDQDVIGVAGSCEPNDSFGWCLAAGDFNGDGYDDLAVGVPLEDIGTVANAGAVNIFYGSPSGLTASGNQIWYQGQPGMPGNADADDHLGYSLATGDFDGDGYADLAIGVPNEDFVANDTGNVVVLYGSSTGLSNEGRQSWTQDSPGVADWAEARDCFGNALAAGDFNGDGHDDLAIGVVGESIGSIPGAGEVIVLYGSASGLRGTGQMWHKEASVCRAYDSYGYALAAGDFNGDGYADLAVGVPGDDWFTATNSGSVYVIYGSASIGGLYGYKVYNQGNPDIAGAAESGDNFGKALAAGDFNGDGRDDLAIGSPGEAVGAIAGAGAVNVLFGGEFDLSTAGNKMWHQDVDGVADWSETEDHFGKALAAGDFDGDGQADLAIGVPQEDVNAAADAGLVHVFLSGLSRLVYPHVDATGSWGTEVCAVNTSGSVVSGTFNAFDAAGKRVGSPHPVTLAAHGRMALNVASTFSGSPAIKYITFVHDGGGGVVGYTKFTTTGKYRAALPASAAPSAGDLYISHVASDPTWWTGIGLVNLTWLTKTLTMRFNTGATKTVTLPPHGQTAFLVRDLFGDTAQTTLASAVLEDAAGVVGLELFGQGNQLAGIPLTDVTSTDLFFPHIHSDAEWWTGLAAYNPHATSTTLTITPYSAAGEELTGQSIPVSAKGKYVGLVESLSLPAGTAWIKVTAPLPVTGFELFGTNDEKLLAGLNAVNLTRTSGVFPKIDPNGWTGIALVNTTASPALVTLTAYRDDGTVVASLWGPYLFGYAKTLGFVEDFFSGTDISAATHLSFTATGPVAGFQLNGSSDGWLLDGLPGM